MQPYILEKGMHNHENVTVAILGQLHRATMIDMSCVVLLDYGLFLPV